MRLFGSNPLYHHVAYLMEDSPLIKTIVIDTDSEIIAEDALKTFKKAAIIERPQNLRGDMVPMNAIIEYDLSCCDDEHFLQTHSTNPLLTKYTLELAIQEYFQSLEDYDSLFSVTMIQSRLYWSSGEPVNHNPNELLRTQDLPPIYEENSNFYIFSKSSFLAAGNRRIGLKPKMFPINKLEAIDIDEEEDFQLAEALLIMRNKDK